MMQIRKAVVADAGLLAQMGAETFYESYSHGNTAEDMQQYINEHFTVAKMESFLAGENGEIYIAENDGEAVGYLQLAWPKEHDHFPGKQGMYIERVYVYQKFQGLKTGAAFIETSAECCSNSGCHYLWLTVWDQNTRAISFYKNQGFIPFGNTTFILGNDRQTDFLLYKPSVNF
jgi:GNAT superfamily N-acetyltransferase